MCDSPKLTPRREAKAPFFVGIDLGGTNIKVGVVDDLGRPVSYTKIDTNLQRGPEDAVRRMADAVGRTVSAVELEEGDIPHVGLGAPGTMDIPAGMLLEPVNLPGWEQFPIRDRLAERCGKPVAFANDAGAAAYGEYWVGSGREFHSMILLTLGTGVGGGIIIDGLSIDGEHSHGAECGHIIIDYGENARTCPWGGRGHLEAYASATALVRRTEEAIEAGAETTLRGPVGGGEELTALLIYRHAEAGDDFSRGMILETARYLAVGVTSLMHTIDPAGVILGGAMNFGGHATATGRAFLDEVRREVRRLAFPVPAAKCVIDYASLAGDAGFIGAAGIARAAFLKSKK